MNNENEIIGRILRNFRKSPLHRNEFFHSDSEIFTLDGKDYLISADGYSDEDHFRLDDPFILGSNLAACTLSDIYACGGKPLFYCNSLNCDPDWSADYIDTLSKGIASVIEKSGAGFLGGDLGSYGKWNFTGIVIGEAERIVTRKGAKPGDLLYLTGEIGGGNFEAVSVLSSGNGSAAEFFHKNRVKFPVRMKEAELVSKYANCCIDSSDGLFRSLDIISEINECGYAVSGIPYFSPGELWAKGAGIPKEALMFGECGEYELLFAVSPENEKILLEESRTYIH